MGLASSQARLLSITSRLTSNEYESQQISNAKMRLATQSQEASEAYLAALSDTQFSFVSFNSEGSSSKTPLTAAMLYEYSDNKNQYILTNSAGKVLLSSVDQSKFRSSQNLDEFLSKFGITKSFRTKKLETTYNQVFNEYSDYAKNWQEAVKNYPYGQDVWANDKMQAQTDYYNSREQYTLAVNSRAKGDGKITNEDVLVLQKSMEAAKEKFTNLLSYVSAKESKIIKEAEGGNSGYKVLYDNYSKYQNALAEYNDELEELGISPNDAFEYDDASKAQWYTNLWFKINGPSTDKSELNNYTSFIAKDGIREYQDGNEIPQNDSKILNSTVWINNALSKGLISIEKASFNGSEMTIEDINNPFKFNLNGISWTGSIYSSIQDIVESDNDKAVAKAEAEYQRKTAEINAKDEKYQRKLNLLDTQHNAIQTEYESVKNAMNKNIDRSFKAFQG